MVTTLGNATGGNTYGAVAVDLPRDTARIRPAHKPWCTRCKRTGRDLDVDQLCEPCARAAVSAAALRERWAEAEQAEKEAARVRPPAPRPKRKTRRSPRPSRSTGSRPRVNLPVAEVAAAYQAGASLKTLAKQYGCSDNAIRHQLVNAGITLRPRFMTLDVPGETRTQVRDLYVDQQLSLADVAEAAGLKTSVVIRVLDEAGIERRKPGATLSHLTPAEQDAVIEAYQAGESGTDLAIRYGVANHVIHSLLGRRGIKRRSARASVVDLDEADVVRRYKAGASAPEVARAVGCTAKRVRGILDRHNVPRRDDRSTRSGGYDRRLEPDPEVLEMLCARYADGATIQDLVKLTGHGSRQVTRVLREAGVTLRPAAHLGTQLTAEQVSAAVAEYVAGAPLNQVARTYRLRPERLRAYVIEAGHRVRHNAVSAETTGMLRAHGLTSLQVKQWAVDTGRLDHISRGNVPLSLIEAYLEHHQGVAA